MQDKGAKAPDRALFRVFVAGLLALQAAKLWIGAGLGLHPDEAFYWFEAQYPALSYSDVPLLTPLLVWLGTALAGDTALGVRLAFLGLGALIPLAVVQAARAFLPPAGALWAGLLALVLPFLSLMGLLAVPDVPLILLSILWLGLFARATQTGTRGAWVMAGLVAALAINAHYRFAFVLLGAGFYLLLAPVGRRHLLGPGLWIGGAVALLGLLPVVLFNLTNDLAGLRYHFVDRHPWQFDPEGLWFLPGQALIVTPVLFAALAWAYGTGLARAIRGDDRAALLVAFATAGILSFALMKPWAVGGSAFTAHWPVFGYVPLLILLAGALSGAAAWLRWLVAGSAAAILALVIGYLAIESRFDRMPPAVQDRLSGRLAGWEALGERAAALAAAQPEAGALVVADRVTTQTYIAFALNRPGDVYTIDERRIGEVRGRAKQVAIWQLNEAGLRNAHAGEAAVIVVETRLLTADYRDRLCGLFAQVEPRGELLRPGDGRRFAFFLGRGLLAEPAPGRAMDAPDGGLCR